MGVTGLQFPPTNWPGGRYSFLLAALLLIFAIDPLLRDSVVSRTVLDILTILLFVAGALSLGNRKLVWAIAAVLVGPELVGLGLGWLLEEHGSLGRGFGGTLRATAAIAFCAFMTSQVMRDVLSRKRVTSDTICASMCVYLLLGLLWAYLYLLIAHFVPGSFSANEELVVIASAGDAGEAFSLLTYFSFVTLTTLGFGDISPVSPIARTACWMEAITGQLFLAILVAGLVGKFIAQGSEKPGDGSHE